MTRTRTLVSAMLTIIVLASLTLGAAETYIVGIDANYPPWAWFQEGEYRGLEVDLIAAIAEHVGWDLEWVALPWDTAVPALKAGNLDLLAGGMFITCQRELVIDFTAPYYRQRGYVLVKKGSEETLGSVLGGGRRIAGMAGGTEFEWILDQEARGADLIPVSYESNELALLDLMAGRVSAVVADAVVAYDYIELYDIEIAGEIYKGYDYEVATGVQQGDPDGLVAGFNEGLAWLWETGEFTRLWVKYMNPRLPTMGPLPLERATICE